MNNNGGTLNRQLRNLIESPKLLNALRQVLSRGSVYGSNVWSGALNILSNFLHNEPTGFPVIAEAHLPDIFIESVTQNSNGSEVGVLPASEAIQAVPTAFDATCLNENGLKQFQESKALESFFRIFESPDHVKGMDMDTSDVPTILGNAFDELVRHHPQLKQRVLDNVVEMVKRVRDLCFKRASEQGVGTKLWVTGDDGKLYVAGGRRALLGKDEEPTKASQQTDESGDVDMLRDETEKGKGTNSNEEVSIDDVVETEDAKSGPTVTQYIGIVSRFLGGYFNNKSCCQSFLEAGALDDLLDFATLW
jgi:E3 ubiquitin-protein ligase HUWE1